MNEDGRREKKQRNDRVRNNEKQKYVKETNVNLNQKMQRNDKTYSGWKIIESFDEQVFRLITLDRFVKVLAA